MTMQHPPSLPDAAREAIATFKFGLDRQSEVSAIAFAAAMSNLQAALDWYDAQEAEAAAWQERRNVGEVIDTYNGRIEPNRAATLGEGLA